MADKKIPQEGSHQNPLDLLGDANTDGYKNAIDIFSSDKNIDVIVLIVLYQTPLVSTDIVDTIIEYNDMKKKPIVVVSAGGEFTEVLKENLENNGVPNFTFPENAIRAVRHLVEYHGRK
jgi:acetyltransferase